MKQTLPHTRHTPCHSRAEFRMSSRVKIKNALLRVLLANMANHRPAEATCCSFKPSCKRWNARTLGFALSSTSSSSLFDSDSVPEFFFLIPTLKPAELLWPSAVELIFPSSVEWLAGRSGTRWVRDMQRKERVMTAKGTFVISYLGSESRPEASHKDFFLFCNPRILRRFLFFNVKVRRFGNQWRRIKWHICITTSTTTTQIERLGRFEQVPFGSSDPRMRRPALFASRSLRIPGFEWHLLR